MYGPKRYGFSVVLIIKGASILTILVINRVWFLRSSFELNTFIRSYLFIIIDKTINKSPSQCLLLSN